MSVFTCNPCPAVIFLFLSILSMIYDIDLDQSAISFYKLKNDVNKTLCMLGNFFMFLLLSADFFLKSKRHYQCQAVWFV